ncbi:MAG TPA: hypothetical protein VF247_11940 [Candidatus Krumholzibacteria bacterium]
MKPDYKELFELLNAHEVEYVIVGAVALAFHGIPRYTGDIDVLVARTPTNAARLMAALTEFGFGKVGLMAADFEAKDNVVQLGVPPVRIDIMTSIDGVAWDEAVASRVSGDYGGVPVWVIGREMMIKNKRATGRLKDLADVEALEEQ